MHITLLATSIRPHSNTLRFIHFLQHLLAEHPQHSVSVVSFENYDLPFVGQAVLKPEQLTPFQKTLIDAWEKADLVIIAMPEYNWTAPAQATNMIHHFGGPAFKHLFSNRTFALAGISNGRGGRQPALDVGVVLNKMISFTNSDSIVSPKIYESHETDKNLNPDGTFAGHEVYDNTARNFLNYSVSVAQRWLSGKPA